MADIPLIDVAFRQAHSRNKPRELYDSRGLSLEITPHRTKNWRFKYRFGDKEKHISPSIYLEVLLKLTRERRDEARKCLVRDIDPSAYKCSPKPGTVRTEPGAALPTGS